MTSLPVPVTSLPSVDDVTIHFQLTFDPWLSCDPLSTNQKPEKFNGVCMQITVGNFFRWAPFTTFMLQNDGCNSRQIPLVFRIEFPFSWQSLDLFLGLFSGFGRNLVWQDDNVVEFVQICHFFMVSERFINDIFRVTFPLDYCHSFRENQFCEVLFALKFSGYLILARNLMSFALRRYEDIFCFFFSPQV